MSPLRFLVLGEPKAQPRVKAMRRGNFISMYTPATAKEWKGLIAKAVKPFLLPEPIDQPLSVTCTFYMPRPKAHYLKAGLRPGAPYWHTNKPDSDNLLKAVLDVLTDSGLWSDDSIVCKTCTQKVYAEEGEIGCLIEINPL